jgi:hypothetical protein
VVIETFGSKNFGAINGAMNVGMAVPALIAPVVAGVCFDASGNYRVAFGLTIGVFGAGVLSLLATRYCRPAEAQNGHVLAPTQRAQPNEAQTCVAAGKRGHGRFPSNGETAP